MKMLFSIVAILIVVCILGLMIVSTHMGESPTKDERCRGGHDF